MLRHVAILLALVCLGFSAAPPLHAQEAASGEAAASSGSLTPAQKAGMIRQLMAGKLVDPVDPATLFSWSLHYRDVLRSSLVLRMTSDRTFYDNAKADVSLLAPLGPEEARLAIAQADFLRLPQSRRKELLERHASQVNARRHMPEVEQLEQEVAALQGFLAGEPVAGDAGAFSLVSKDGKISAAARSKIGAVSDDIPVAERINRLQVQRDMLREQILALPEDELRTLAERRVAGANGKDSVAQAKQDKREARLESEQAFRVSQTAESGSVRLVASERAALLALKAKQADYRVAIAGQVKEPNEILDAALGERQKVNEIVGSRLPSTEKRTQADTLYRQLVLELQDVRKRLRAALDENPSRMVSQLRPAPLDDALISQAAGGKELDKLQKDLAANALLLESETTELLWKKRAALEEAMVILNDSRLALIGELTPATRRQLLGFGKMGTEQVWREVVQITLVVRFYLQGYGRQVSRIVESLLSPTPALVLTLMELLLAILLFRLWRVRGDVILARSEMRARSKRPPTLLSSMLAKLIVYVRRIKTPLDWFIFVQIFRWLLPEEFWLPGLELLWIVLTWLLGAMVLIRLIDELAKGGRKVDPRADLRWKSLRLLGWLIVGVGMILRLTSTLVGEGAIYSWVLSACWILVPLVALILVHWWRDRIVELSAEGASESSLLSWNAQNPKGITGLLGRVLAGGYLLVQGAFRIAVRQFKRIALVRDIYGQRSREQVAKQEAELLSSGMYERPDAAVLDALRPDLHSLDAFMAKVWPVDITADIPAPGTISAVVGDRGSGKSSMLLAQEDALHAGAGSEVQRVRFAIDEEGLPGLLRELTASFDGAAKGTPSIGSVLELLRRREGEVQISLDDVQRMIEPSIGGLRDFDALVALARACPPNFRWVFVIGRPAWTFLSRARFDRLIFDRVLHMPRWDFATLRELLEQRMKLAGVQPDFSELQDEGAFIFESDMTSQERRIRTYFDRLFDYAGGNPAVTLEFWRQSLFVKKETGRIVVHPFATPDSGKITALPDAALFVLRTVVQMDRTSESAIQRCTDLSPVIISDVLRSLARIGVLEHSKERGYRVTMLWWREVVGLLERRNLIVAEARK